MDLAEKVRRLLGRRNKSQLSRDAGLPKTAIDAIVNKGRMPLADNGVKIARVLGVSADWLFDETADWPPPDKAASRRTAEHLTDGELVGLIQARFGRLLEQAEREFEVLPTEKDEYGRTRMSKEERRRLQLFFGAFQMNARQLEWAGGSMLHFAGRIQRVLEKVRRDVLGTDEIGTTDELKRAYPEQYGRPDGDAEPT